MSYPCDAVQFTCGGTKEALTSATNKINFTHTEGRKFTLTYGGGSSIINGRTRGYTYSDEEFLLHDNVKYVVTPADFGAYYAECFDSRFIKTGTITEDYTTVDATFFYVDLRNDLLIYEENIQTMKFSQTTSGGSNKTGRFGNLVYLHTGYDDAKLVPFILENVPIAITNKIVCTAFAVPLHEETINSGYWNGIRVLMPLFNNGVPRHDIITIEGVQYDAFDVDWYLINAAQREADGDSFFWWPDWLKAVGVDTITWMHYVQMVETLDAAQDKYPDMSGAEAYKQFVLDNNNMLYHKKPAERYYAEIQASTLGHDCGTCGGGRVL